MTGERILSRPLQSGDRWAQHLMWEPGDATRYELIVVPVEGPLETGNDLGSIGGPGALVVDAMHRRVCLMPLGVVDAFEFCEHLDLKNECTIYQFGRALLLFEIRLHDLEARGAALSRSGYRGFINPEHRPQPQTVEAPVGGGQ